MNFASEEMFVVLPQFSNLVLVIVECQLHFHYPFTHYFQLFLVGIGIMLPLSSVAGAIFNVPFGLHLILLLLLVYAVFVKAQILFQYT